MGEKIYAIVICPNCGKENIILFRNRRKRKCELCSKKFFPLQRFIIERFTAKSKREARRELERIRRIKRMVSSTLRVVMNMLGY